MSSSQKLTFWLNNLYVMFSRMKEFIKYRCMFVWKMLVLIVCMYSSSLGSIPTFIPFKLECSTSVFSYTISETLTIALHVLTFVH